MFKCERLSKKTFSEFDRLNKKRTDFNVLNEDFVQLYNQSNFAQQLFLKNRIRLLLKDGIYIGYIWATFKEANEYVINSMIVLDKEFQTEALKFLLKNMKSKAIFTYICEDNGDNYKILCDTGFTKVDGSIKMNLSIDKELWLNPHCDIKFEVLKRGSQEGIRCRIQNEVFKNDGRIPLTVDDIQYDELQDYYFEHGAILIKKDNSYIGYGQIIIDEGNPTIVNVGVLPRERGKGYGRSLMLYLINILKEEGFNSVNIKVASDNSTAINLYNTIGFKEVGQCYNWIIKTSR